MFSHTAKRLFTVSDYHKMAETGILEPDARVELLCGEIINMSPINSDHASLVDQITALLYQVPDLNAIIRIQNPLTIDEYSEPEPDIVVVKKDIDKYRNAHPKPSDVLILIEVADSSLELDRTNKKALYATSGIPEYWIVNLKDSQIEVFTKPKDGYFEEEFVFRSDEIVTATEIPFELSLSEIF